MTVKYCRFHERAIIGEKPLRKIRDCRLSIGDHAVCMSGAVIYQGSRIGAKLMMGHNAIIREENRIGDNFSLWGNSIIDYGCVIGNNVLVHCNCYIAQFTVIEDGVFIAPGAITTNDIHPGCIKSKDCLTGPRIGKGAQIGAGAIILPGVVVGAQALIGAGSVVTQDVPFQAVVYGNPARVVMSISELECRRKLLKQYIPRFRKAR